MASSIISTTIDETFPVAGQDNDSQGFRDNFTIIKDNFAFAKSEIEALQDNAAVRNSLNNYNNNTQEKLNLKEYTIQSFNGSSGVGITYSFTNGQFVKYIIQGNLTLTIVDWPTNEPYQYAEILFALVSNGGGFYDVTFASKFGPTVNSNLYNDSSSEKYLLKQHNHTAVSTSTSTISYDKLTYIKPGDIVVDSTTVHTIVSQGTSDFTAIGAADNNPGTTFVPTDTTIGTGLLSAYLPDNAVSTITTTTTINNSSIDATSPWNGSILTLSNVTTNYKLVKAFTFNGGQDVYLEYLGTFTELP